MTLQQTLAVSIPSSSGHQFTVHLQLTRTRFLGARFNPFFIRASVYCLLKNYLQALKRQGFNPFFIRASVYWQCAER